MLLDGMKLGAVGLFDLNQSDLSHKQIALPLLDSQKVLLMEEAPGHQFLFGALAPSLIDYRHRHQSEVYLDQPRNRETGQS